MSDAISNTSPLLFLHALGHIDWLEDLFALVLVPNVVVAELAAGARLGLPTPSLGSRAYLRIVDVSPAPSEWLSTDLGIGELAVIALALERNDAVVLLDDSRARRVAAAAGLDVWGTLRILLEAKRAGLTPRLGPHLDSLQDAGMWLTDDLRRRILALAEE